MEKIGSILKETRIEKGLTLEDLSSRTRLQITYLKAIEEGNLDFFKDDLSYVSFYVRHYATELGVDYNNIKESLDDTVYDYTKSLDIGEVRKNLEISDRIKRQSEQSQKRSQSKNKSKTYKRKRRFDLSMVAFIVTAGVVFATLAFVLVHYVPQWMNQDPVTPPPIVDNGNGNGSGGEEKPDGGSGTETPEPPVVKEITVTPESDTVYIISNWTPEKNVEFTLTVNTRTWFQVSVNDKILSNPVSRIYEKGDVVQAIEIGEADKVVYFNVGYFSGNKIMIDGKEVQLPESIANNKGSAKLYFKFAADGGTQ